MGKSNKKFKHITLITPMFDAIIVLGGGMNDKDWKGRVDAGLRLYRQKKAPRIIMSGKHEIFGDATKTEAERMKQYAISKGTPRKNILKEEDSMNTIGNAFFTLKNILKPRKWNKILVVTSDYHLTRTKFIFQHVMKKHKIEFVASKTIVTAKERKEIEKREKKLFTFTKDFAKLIPIGELAVIEKFLFDRHPLYKK